MCADRARRTKHQRVAVVGAGMVGLATAWFLRDRDVEVEVFERRAPGAGASWGNAGWLTPSLMTPLPEPAMLRYGPRAMLDPVSPVYVPLTSTVSVWRFLASFARHCTTRRWREAMNVYRTVNLRALDAFDELVTGGVPTEVREAEPFLACFADPVDQRALLGELAEIQRIGQHVDVEVLDGDQARRLVPILTEHVTAAVRLRGQRFINPPQFIAALAQAVTARGATLSEDHAVVEVRDTGADVLIATRTRHSRFDAAVLATGAWLPELAARFGVRRVVQAGRGYSFTVSPEHLPTGPIYFPAQRVACTPLGDRLRIAGMMEFRRPEAPLDPRRVNAIATAVRPFLRGVDLADRHDEWVGSRPCTSDGLPLIGATTSPRVFVAGGHGMWGIALGPLTGRLLAEAITTGHTPAELRPFDPLR